MTDHKEIWLQPWCADCAKHLSEGREWCSSDQWGECWNCGAKATRYVLAEPRKLKISYLVAGEEGVVARGFKSEEDAKIYADALNAGKFPRPTALEAYQSYLDTLRPAETSQQMTQQQQANEIYEAARRVGAGIMTDPLHVIQSLNGGGYCIVPLASNKAKP